MRICVFSDAHGRTDAIDVMLAKCGDVDFFIHLGDYESDGEYVQAVTDKPLYWVSGNCDMKYGSPAYKIVTVGDVNIFITHGHTYSVSERGTRELYKAAEQAHCDIALFGHTHISHISMEDNIWLVNPGSPSRPRGRSHPSYAIITIEGKRINPKIQLL